jgi:NitT/TauT family transport system substrate-binding protein
LLKYGRIFLGTSVVLVLILAASTTYLLVNPVTMSTTVTKTETAGSGVITPETPTVSISESVDTYSGSGPIDIAISQGLFSKLGLSVKLVTTVNNVQALAGGQVQFAVSGPPFAADSAGADLVAVGQMLPNFPAAIISAPSVKTLSDLNGKTFGCTSAGSLTCIMSYELIKSQNWTYSPDLIKPIGSQNALITALENGDVQAIIFNWGTGLQLQSQGKANLLGDISTYVPTWYASCILTSRTFAADNPNTVRLFLTGLYQANLWIANNPNATIQWIQTQFSVNNVQAQVLYNTTRFALVGTMQPSVIQHMYDVTNSQFDLPQVNWQDMYTNKYLPNITFSPSA